MAKFVDSYNICNKYITLPRVQKIMQKLSSEIGDLDKKDTPRVLQTVYHDMLSEEIWAISKKAKTVDFDTLKRVCNKKTRQIFHDILNNSLSIADA